VWDIFLTPSPGPFTGDYENQKFSLSKEFFPFRLLRAHEMEE